MYGWKSKNRENIFESALSLLWNGRLFDIGLEAKGTVRIKCPVCRNPVEIQLENCDESRQKRLIAYYRNS